ncbi:cation:proton antiporter [Alkalibacter mobilis]|uniref:cation:proton antiporter n=1 Tax=Alkalibacter mobilis TaxID=2787712 RepID=UPI00189E93EF|nr:cation:proton antiporter [Alkalibacter mobilis]MBF7097276.1 cation:proton antiporter [Alkalibacter mobilis]
MILLISRLLLGVLIAYFSGKLISKLRLPAILGWLIAGMVMGPYASGLLSNELLDIRWYHGLLNVLECGMGLMIGSELVIKDLKQKGRQIVVTTIFQSATTFIVVALFFGVIFYFANIPLNLALIFGGIALATAPAPALSVVREFRTEGPVTRTLIPMAALDDIVAIIVFFSINSVIAASHTANQVPLFTTLALMILLPIAIGMGVGLVGGIILKKEMSKSATVLSTISLILASAVIGFVFNTMILTEPVMNFMLIGMAFSGTFANMVSKERLVQIMDAFSPFLMFSLMIVIMNLGAPLNYNLILNAGLFTAIYIVSRALGKYSGSYLGAKVTGMPETVKKYLGLTLLPHSGVSLIFTAIAAATLNSFDPDSAIILQGTIAAAAVINEIIAVIAAKKAFQWAGELEKQTPHKVSYAFSVNSN